MLSELSSLTVCSSSAMAMVDVLIVVVEVDVCGCCGDVVMEEEVRRWRFGRCVVGQVASVVEREGSKTYKELAACA